MSPLQPTIVTRGQAIVTARPDRAFVTIAAESRSKNSAEAQKQNAAAMTAVLQKIEQAGVPKDAVRTVGYDLQPEFDYANGRQTFRNYLARNTVEVRLDDIDRVGIVIDAAAAGGATTITGIRFDVRNRAALEREALRQAVADARARADAAAAGAGASDRSRRAHRRGSALRTAAADDAHGRASRRARRLNARRAVDDRDPIARDADGVDPLKKRGRVQFSGDAGENGTRPSARAMTADDMARARRVLMRRDPVLAPIIKKYGACGIKTGREGDIFCGLVEAIVSQQLSTRAAATIYGRLRALLPNGGTPTPEALLAIVGRSAARRRSEPSEARLHAGSQPQDARRID